MDDTTAFRLAALTSGLSRGAEGARDPTPALSPPQRKARVSA